MLCSTTRGRTFLTHPNPSSFMLVIVQKIYDFRSMNVVEYLARTVIS